MEIDIPGTIQSAVELADKKKARVGALAVRDRVFLVDQETGATSEIEPRREDESPRLERVKLLDLFSLIEWCAEFEAGEIRLSRSGESVAVTPRAVAPHEKRDQVSKEFFGDFLPSGEWQPLEKFQFWLDRVRPGMDPQTLELVDVSFGGVSASSIQVVELQVTGAFVNAEVKANEKVGGSRPIPRKIRSRVPFGDPAFTYEVGFVLSVRLNAGKLEFAAHHDINDGAFDAYLAWAREKLAANVSPSWVVLTTR